MHLHSPCSHCMCQGRGVLLETVEEGGRISVEWFGGGGGLMVCDVFADEGNAEYYMKPCI